MFNTERVPVKVYRWDDTGAPKVLSGDGDIKTILKACLVTGYGEDENRKEPLGWEMPFENNNDACFRSKHDKSTKWALGVYGGLNRYGCYLKGLKEPSSERNAKFEMTQNEFYYSNRYGVDENNLQWVLIGHQRAFALVILNSGFADCNGFLYFGDFPSLLVGDVNNCIIASTSGYSNDLIGGWIGGSIANGYKDNNSVDFGLEYKSKGFNTAPRYPNPVTGGFTANEIFISELGDGTVLRGLLPGCFYTDERMPGNDELRFGTIYNNLDKTKDEWIYTRSPSERGFLINLTAWEA